MGAVWPQAEDSSISAQEGTLNRVPPLPSPTRACRGRHSERPCNPTCCRPFVNNMTHSMRPKVAAPSGQSANGCVLYCLPKKVKLFQFVPLVRNTNRDPAVRNRLELKKMRLDSGKKLTIY